MIRYSARIGEALMPQRIAFARCAATLRTYIYTVSQCLYTVLGTQRDEDGRGLLPASRRTRSS